MGTMPAIDPKSFWNQKILGWEDSRYSAAAAAPSWVERWAGRASSSLRYRQEAALALLAPHLGGRRVIELGCGSGLLAERLVALGAASYRGFDLAEAAVGRARQRMAGRPLADRIRFDVAGVAELPPQGNALVFSLGLFDWLSAAEIAHVFAIGRQGAYLHAASERRWSPQQLLHRIYVQLSYGRRTGYAPRYHQVAELDGLLAAQGAAPAQVFRHRRLRFGIFLTDLPLP